MSEAAMVTKQCNVQISQTGNAITLSLASSCTWELRERGRGAPNRIPRRTGYRSGGH